jgi:hypothetical protein
MERCPDVSNPRVRIRIGEKNPLAFEAVMEGERAPRTCAAFTSEILFEAL